MNRRWQEYYSIILYQKVGIQADDISNFPLWDATGHRRQFPMHCWHTPPLFLDSHENVQLTSLHHSHSQQTAVNYLILRIWWTEDYVIIGYIYIIFSNLKLLIPWQSTPALVEHRIVSSGWTSELEHSSNESSDPKHWTFLRFIASEFENEKLALERTPKWKNHQIKGYFIIIKLIIIAPYGECPSWRQSTFASASSQNSLHTVPHSPLTQTSTVPYLSELVPERRTAPWVQSSALYKYIWYYIR